MIIGSSRVMMMDPVDVEKYVAGPCFNFGMQGSTAEDYYVVVRALTEEAGLPIRHIVLGVDFEAFNPSIPIMCESRYFEEFSQFLIYTPVERSRWIDRLSLLLSLQQTDESKNVLRRSWLREQSSEPMVLKDNGMAIQVVREQSIAAGTFNLQRILNNRLRKYPSRSLRLDSYRRIDPVRLKYLGDLLSYCKQHKIQVSAFITPYHPQLWTVLSNLPQSRILDSVSSELTSVFAEYGIKLHDFSEIEAFGGEPHEFYDEIHMWPTNEARIVDALFENQSSAAVNEHGFH